MVNRRDAGDGSNETPSYVHLQLSWVSAIISIEIRTMLFDFFDPETVKSDLRGKVTFKKTKISAQTKRYRFTSDEIKHFFLHYLMSEVIKRQVTREARAGVGTETCGRWEVLNPSSRFPHVGKITCLFDPRVFLIPLIRTSNHNQHNQTCCDS